MGEISVTAEEFAKLRGMAAAMIGASRQHLEERERPTVELLERAKHKRRTVYIDGEPVILPGAGEMADVAALQDLENAINRSLTPEQRARRAREHLARIHRT